MARHRKGIRLRRDARRSRTKAKRWIKKKKDNTHVTRAESDSDESARDPAGRRKEMFRNVRTLTDRGSRSFRGEAICAYIYAYIYIYNYRL